MTTHQELENIREKVLQLKLGQSIHQLENYFYTYPQSHDKEQLDAIKNDYQLMTDYWQKGYSDPERKSVNLQLLRRLYTLVNNIDMRYRIRHTGFIMSIYSRARNSRKDWSLTSLRHDLELFVSEVTMLSLEPEHTREEKAARLYGEHQDLMRDLFDYIWTSRSWSDSLAQAFEDILLSPTIDTLDQQLIVSAIMLSAMNMFDINKFRIMVHVYQKSDDPYVRQRALVGWAFSLNEEASRKLFTEERQFIEQLMDDEQCRQELRELQVQIVYCQRAEDDRQRIQEEIMPDLLHSNVFRITRSGIEEVEEDALEDILHPETAERNMERVEEGFHKMMQMQKEGSDIYFGGFSQMKRFPFFNDICNWFVPFHIKHPGISNVLKKLKGNKFLMQTIHRSSFCNSDKYSFALAFEQVLDRLPQNLREMMERGEATMGEADPEELQKPAFIRRAYLQDLYRFFRLFPQRSEFADPFELPDDYVTLLGNPLFRNTPLDSCFTEVAAFLIKQEMYAAAVEVLENCSKELQQGYDFNMLMGTIILQDKEAEDFQSEEDAVDYFKKAVRIKPDSERALRGLARSQFLCKQYAAANKTYDRLLTLQPEKRTYLLNKAVCLSNLEKYEDALKILYKLDYNSPDDPYVPHVLAWTLACNGKYEQAIKLYDRLLDQPEPNPDDLLNYGYCLWFSGNVTGAIGMFRQYCEDEFFDYVEEFFETGYHLLQKHGISDEEIRLMIDAVQ